MRALWSHETFNIPDHLEHAPHCTALAQSELEAVVQVPKLSAIALTRG
jgi:hypothetical protein